MRRRHHVGLEEINRRLWKETKAFLEERRRRLHEYITPKESATIIELALCKVSMNELSPNIEMEDTDTRK
jgi:hypothetical protein